MMRKRPLRALIAGAFLAGSCGLTALVAAPPAGAIVPTVSSRPELASTQAWDLSDDGRFALVLGGGSVKRVDLTDGTSVVIPGAVAASAMSGDGRYVAFSSAANSIVPGDTDGAMDIFRYDIDGTTTELVSPDPTSGFTPEGVPIAISSDGSTVAFQETNGSGSQVVVRDVVGAQSFRPTDAVAAGPGGRKDSFDPRLSGDGLYVSFTLFSANGGCTTGPGCGEVWRADTTNGNLVRASATPGGTEGAGVDQDSDISDDGRFVSFVSDGTDLVTGTVPALGVYRRDLAAGATTLVGPFNRGPGGNTFFGDPRISADGKRVAFMADAPTGAGTNAQVFVRDLGESTASQIGLSDTGGAPNGPTFDPILSADGRTVIYASQATNLLAGGSVAGTMVAGLSGTVIGGATERLVDTRFGQGAPSGLTNAYEVHELTVAGAAGIPADAKAAWLNFTVTEPPEAGFLTAYPCGAPQPLASNLNYAPGQTVANLVLVGIGTGGKVCWFTAKPAHVIVDVQSFEPSTSTYVPQAPVRVLDTRDGTGGRTGALPKNETLELAVTGANGVPADASAVVLNVTVADPVDGGYLTVFPCGTTPPLASNLNYAPGQQVAGLTVAKVGTGGKVCFSVGNETQIVADLQGYEPATSGYNGITPVRVLDTRENIGGRSVPLEGGVIFELPLDPAVVPGTATAVVLNVTITEPVEGGYLTVFTCGTPVTAKSNLNFGPQLTVPNLVIVVPSADDKVCFYPTSDTELVVDVSGWKVP
jgi:Tol biopolymer transport system component